MTGQQLKNSILQMAVQGKLVPQDPNDEPASVLLERIRKEKEQFIKEGKIKKDKNPSYIFRGDNNLPYEKVGKNEPVCIADEVPFEIPESWEWARLSGIVFNRGQMTPSADFCYIDIGSIDNKKQQLSEEENIISAEKAPSRARKVVAQGDILYSTVRPYLHNMCIINKEFSHQPIASTGFAALVCHSDYFNEFLFYYLMSPDFDAYANDTDNAKGVAYPAINDAKLYQALIPVPPYSEQIRIVTKIKELLPYIEKYANAYVEIKHLNDIFPEQLKKSILQEAVQGKLVPQDPNDEPASVLLERIRAEKEALIKAGKIKKDKNESVIFRRDNSHYEKLDGIERCIDDEIPFDIPESWVWTRFGQVISLLSGTDFKTEEYNDTQKGTPYITGASSLSENGVLLNRWTETPRVIANRGDVLLVCKGSGYGKTVICDVEEAHIARQIMAIKKFISLDMHYVRLFLQANFDKIKSRGQGVIPGIDRNSVMDLLFPIPPLSEQRRIVEKQQELFDKLTLI
ncbi:MAG: restriction endonuclease subunit S [Lachnospiraceae bacterium]|nr:restriction endonuclease subunit S [Lachnospiraceae bacterium]